ncbi:MAG: zinc finger Ran-binding domain-containing protein [Candidatus Omnitrophica bacterium]|nr:zinc finger Ran-binding domain-containing protein [Candidatus Omnitrophota bacterium]
MGDGIKDAEMEAEREEAAEKAKAAAEHIRACEAKDEMEEERRAGWTCPHCQTHNVAENKFCFMCTREPRAALADEQLIANLRHHLNAIMRLAHDAGHAEGLPGAYQGTLLAVMALAEAALAGRKG